MTAPLDEKARDAALAAWFANTAQGWHTAMEAAIRAYLAASPSQSEMEFAHVAKTKLDGLLADGWQVNGYSIQKDDRIGLVTTGAFVGWYSNACEAMNTAEAQVLRLTEENEALRELAERLKLEAQGHASEARTANSTIYEIYQVLSGDKGEPGNWHGAEPARRYVEAAEARIKALEEDRDNKIAALRDKVALGANEEDILRFRDGYPNPAGGSKVMYRYTIEQARYRYADAVLAARTTLQKEQADG